MRSTSFSCLLLQLGILNSIFITGIHGSNQLEGRGALCCGMCCGDAEETGSGNGNDNQDGSGGGCNVYDGDDRATPQATPAAKRTPGIGMEFEAGDINLMPKNQLLPAQEDFTQVYMAKGKVIGGRKDDSKHWMLTADTLGEGEALLTTEYILDGLYLKLGSGDLKTAATAAGEDLISWNPHVNMDQNSFNIDGIDLNPWTVSAPATDGDAKTTSFAVQVTAPLPFATINELLGQLVQDIHKSTLLSSTTDARNGIFWVTRDLFKGSPSPGNVNTDSLKDDFLGFLSLVVSYAKADKAKIEESIKTVIPIMPRNDFTSMYKLLQAQGSLPSFGSGGNLWQLVLDLSCWKYDKGKLVFDSDFCDMNVDPQPNALESNKPKADKLKNMSYQRGNRPACNMEDWINGIAAGTSLDCISDVDVAVDGSVGRLRDSWETVLDTDTEIPIFEFRRLKAAAAGDWGNRAQAVEDELLGYHKSFKGNTKRLRRSRDARRKAIRRSACAATTTTTATPSCVVQDKDPGLGITSQGCICQGSSTWAALSTSSGATQGAQCAYTTPPSVQATITQAPGKPTTNTQACLVCTPLLNAEDECSSLANCKAQTAYVTATVNSSPIYYGTLSSDALFTGVSTALKSACTSVTTTTSTIAGKATAVVACNKDKDYIVSNKIPYTEGGVLEDNGILSINVGSYAASANQLNALLAVAGGMVAGSAGSSPKSCHTMQYADPVVGPGRRGIFGRSVSPGFSIFARDHPAPSFSEMQVCNGPAVVVASYWAPGYQARIGSGKLPIPDAQITATLKFSQGTDGAFFCEVVAGMAGTILSEAAPELAEIDVVEAEQIEAVCMEGIDGQT